MLDKGLIGIIRQHRLTIVILAVVLLAALIASRFSIIYLNPGQGSGSRTVYHLHNQQNGKVIKIESGSSPLRRIVAKSTYEIMAQRDSLSSFAIVETKGFFRTTAHDAVFNAESSRQFVGSNPAPCMHYTGILYSYVCAGSLDSLMIHIPGTADVPTYTENNRAYIEDEVESLLRIEGADYVLTRAFDAEGESTHIAYRLEGGIVEGSGTELQGLDATLLYHFIAYGRGFLAYDENFGSLMYFTSLGSSPTQIKLAGPTSDKLKPYWLDAKNETILIAYSDNVGGEDADIHDEEANVSTQVEVHYAGSSKYLEFDDRQYRRVLLCGTQKICMLSGEWVYVHDISGSKPKLLYKVGGVRSVTAFDDRLLVAREQELLLLDIESGRGYKDYSLGSYQFCGLQSQPDSYLVCLINSRSKKMALLITPGQPDTDGIDKKVEKLLALPEVADISVYKQFVYISPEAGELKFIPSLDGYGYDPEKKAEAAKKIYEATLHLDISKNGYRVINTLE